MKKTFFKTGLVLVIALLAMSCSKDGSDGAIGATGATGANGSNGTNGTNGNANVIGTNTVSVPPSSWTSSAGNTVWITTLSAVAITQTIVDRGTVSVFFQSGSGWIALPYSNPQNHYFTNFGFALGVVQLAISTESGYVLNSPGTNVFRVVVISPSNKMANPSTNWNDYQQVKQALNLVD
jgi:hypothetical protein